MYIVRTQIFTGGDADETQQYSRVYMMYHTVRSILWSAGVNAPVSGLHKNRAAPTGTALCLTILPCGTSIVPLFKSSFGSFLSRKEQKRNKTQLNLKIFWARR